MTGRMGTVPGARGFSDIEGSGLDLQTRLRPRNPPLLLSDCAFIERAESHSAQDADLGPSRL